MSSPPLDGTKRWIIYCSQNNESMTLLNLIVWSFQMICIFFSLRNHGSHCTKAEVGTGAFTGRKNFQGHAGQYSDLK